MSFCYFRASPTMIFQFSSPYKEISNQNQYKFVWIPIVDHWTDDMQKKFEMLQSEMPQWCIVHNFSFKLGIKYIKEEWKFKDKPIVVVMNSQGIVQHPNALPMITISGAEAFPFTTEKEQELSNGVDWFGYLMFYISPEVLTLIKRRNHIIFYGGMDKELKQKFTNKAKALAKDLVMEKAKISIDLFCVEKGSKGCDNDRNILRDFWNCIASFKTHKEEVKKLLSYETKSGWAVWCKGSKFEDIGYGTTILKDLEEFEKPTQQLTELQNDEDWLGYLMIRIIPKEEKVLSWMEQGKHIFFYAGSDGKWKKEFSERVTALAKDPEILNANISIISYQMSMESTGMYGDYNKGIAGRFRFELLSPKNIAFKSAATQQEMKDLHSDGNGAGWAMLCKGYKLKVRANQHWCHFDIPVNAGKISKTINSHRHRVMDALH
ncbi:protein SIEVE ELEMENT OCCLUSION B-like [Fagus crenata]